MSSTFPRERRFTVTEDHLKLVRHMYADWNHLEFGAPSVDPKRPYGNKDVLDDMRAILGRKSDEELIALHREMATVLQIALRTGAFTAGDYDAQPYFEDWQPLEVADA